MQRFFESYTFMISFILLCIIINMLLGKVWLERFLMIVLISMVVLNADKFATIMDYGFGSAAKVGTKKGTTVDKTGSSGMSGKF